MNTDVTYTPLHTVYYIQQCYTHSIQKLGYTHSVLRDSLHTHGPDTTRFLQDTLVSKLLAAGAIGSALQATFF